MAHQDDNVSCYDCMGGLKGIIISVLVFLAAFFIAIFVGVSYHKLRHDQYGLDKNTIKNDVDTGTVYYRGNHFLGVSHEFLTFPSTYQEVDFSLSVSSKNGLEFRLNCFFQYLIDREKVGQIFEAFSTNIHSQVVTRATAAIKKIAPTYTTQDFYQKRIEIQNALWIAIRDELKVINALVPEHKFQLGHPDFTPLIDNQNLNAAIQIQNNIREQIQQKATITAEETKQQVTLIEANATRVLQEAESISRTIKQQTLARANAIRENAKTSGLSIIFTKFNINKEEDKALFNKFSELDKATHVKILDNVASLVKTSEVV